jgi:hypothetical protein
MKISRTIFVAILCAGTLAMLSSPGGAIAAQEAAHKVVVDAAPARLLRR